MKKRFFLFSLITAILISLFSFPAFADTGPKPSVNIEFTGIKENFYVVLLSETKSIFGDVIENIPDEELGEEQVRLKKIGEIFSQYTDPDGYSYRTSASITSDVYKNASFYPSSFKVLVYFPSTDSFAVSKIYEKHAFDAYYKIDLSGTNEQEHETTESGIRITYIEGSEIITYDYSGEAVKLIARILITLLIELLLAHLFGISGRRSFILLTVINVATQLLLNSILNAAVYLNGAGHDSYVLFLTLELAIFTAEALIYAFTLPRFNNNISVLAAVLYGLCANLSSVAIGWQLYSWIPEVF